MAKDAQTAATKEQARARQPTAVETPIPLPEGRYRCLVIDPPWPMDKIERDERPKQGVTLNYPTMDVYCIREPEEDEACVRRWRATARAMK
jgi:hypothetical protein